MVKLIETIHPNDTMFRGDKEAYFRNGNSAVHAIELALAALGENNKINSILDFGCGYGRVMRSIRQKWPNAQLAASDLIKNAVNFCSETFNAIPIHGSEELLTTGFENNFDLIWVGSVFTHLPEEAWIPMIKYLADHLRLDGKLIFTTHGRTSQWVFEKHSLKKSHISEEDFFASKIKVKETGFAFLPYSLGLISHLTNQTGASVSQGKYGVSFSSAKWVISKVSEVPNLTLQGFYEGAWGKNHDVVCLTKPSDLRIV